MSVNRSYSPRAQHTRKSALRLSESYVQFQQVKSRFRKHSPGMPYIVHVMVLLGLIFGLAQIARGICFDAYRLSVLMDHHGQIQGYFQDTQTENQSLKEKIAIYSSPAGIEELARNNLERVGSNEILVRLYQ